MNILLCLRKLFEIDRIKLLTILFINIYSIFLENKNDTSDINV